MDDQGNANSATGEVPEEPTNAMTEKPPAAVEQQGTNDTEFDSGEHKQGAAKDDYVIGCDNAFTIQVKAVEEENTEILTAIPPTSTEVGISFDETTANELLPDAVLPTDSPLSGSTQIESTKQNDALSPSELLRQLSREHSLMDNENEEEDDPGTDCPAVISVDNGEAMKEHDHTKKEEQSLGAQILMNRFSSWRQIATETVTTNAQTILQSKVGQQLANRANETTRTLNATTKTLFASKHTPSSSTSEEVEESSSLEEEGTATEEDRVDEEISQGSTDDDEGPAVVAAVAVRSAAHVATSVVESVATGFRGRYNVPDGEQLPPSARGGTQSQTALILQSRAASHMQGILGSLDESHEYVMLLGNGMLGVTLKQSFLKNHGVYVDYLVRDGHAYKSAVVHVGDTIVKVGDQDVTRGSILNIPQTIAKSKRPVVLVLSTGQKTTLDRVNYVDIAIAMMHRIRADQNQRRDISRMPLNISTNLVGDTRNANPENDDAPPLDWSVPAHSLDSPNPANVPSLPIAAKATLSRHLPKRGNDKFSLSMLLQAKASISNFQTILKYAFIMCAMDGRRLPFLSAHLSSENSIEAEDLKANEDSQKTTASTQLMLFLELISFVELYDATPLGRHRDIAKKIAYKFFLPTRIGTKMEQPMFDFSHIVTKADLNALVMAINDKNASIPRSLFLSFQHATVEALSGAPFLNFLMSNDCARMRGYLRNTAPYQTISPTAIIDAIVQKNSHDAHNHFMYTLLHLLCQNERDVGGENSDIMPEKAERVLGAAGGLCCAVFIKTRLHRIIEMSRPLVDTSLSTNFHSEDFSALITAFDFLWEVFVSPDGGAVSTLPHSNETDDSLGVVRRMLEDAASLDKTALSPFLVDSKLQLALDRLAGDLVYDYAVNTYPKFKEHKFHEWLCTEVTNGSSLKQDNMEASIPPMLEGSVKRLLRKAELPTGLSAHKPTRQVTKIQEGNGGSVEPVCDAKTESRGAQSSGFNEMSTYPNAQIAVVFGTDDGLDAERVPNPAMDHYDIRRYVVQAVELEGLASKSVTTCRIPPTLESYATVPLLRRTPFSKVADQARVSADGWEVSLVDFMIPSADSSGVENAALFGVSLVFQRKDLVGIDVTNNQLPSMKLIFDSDSVGNPETPAKQNTEEVVYDKDSGETIEIGAFASPISFFFSEEAGADEPLQDSECTIKVSTDTPTFNRRLGSGSWLARIERHRATLVKKPSVTIGVALVSSQNVIFAMRNTLSRLLIDFKKASGPNYSTLKCTPLVEILGNFSHQDVEKYSLKCILEPYLRFGSRPWIERPLRNQKAEYDLAAGQQLVESLPHIPLGLLFVAMLLEQKIIISSSRRSSLLAAMTGVIQLLQPLKWAHLLVPLAPVALARDLLQYPAPFIIGLPSEDPGNMTLLNNLPDDVTLVDLDVGRVILAPTIAYDEALLRESEDRVTAGGALRSQILYLAQSLGVLFGSKLRARTWCSDSPLSVVVPKQIELKSDFEVLKEVCQAFVTELLAGASSCCYWIEEAKLVAAPISGDLECTVLFDEDRFFNVKNFRALHGSVSLFGSKAAADFAMSLDDFDLIIECFLRCQSMSTFISSRKKTEMAFC